MTNLETIKSHFSSLLLSTQHDLSVRNVDVSSVHQFLSTFFQIDDIPNTADVEELFRSISVRKLWCFDHCSPLERLVNHFIPEDDNYERDFSRYKSFLSGYYMILKLVDFVSFTNILSEDDFESDDDAASATRKLTTHEYRRLKVCLRLERKVDERSLTYVYKIWKSVAKEYDLPPLRTVLDNILFG